MKCKIFKEHCWFLNSCYDCITATNYCQPSCNVV